MAGAMGDPSAYAETILAYAPSAKKEDVQLFVGRTLGEIVQPRGKRDFGWDCCFQPKDSSLTYAEMSSEQKNMISHRYRAVAKMVEYFRKVGKRI